MELPSHFGGGGTSLRMATITDSVVCIAHIIQQQYQTFGGPVFTLVGMSPNGPTFFVRANPILVLIILVVMYRTRVQPLIYSA